MELQEQMAAVELGLTRSVEPIKAGFDLFSITAVVPTETKGKSPVVSHAYQLLSITITDLEHLLNNSGIQPHQDDKSFEQSISSLRSVISYYSPSIPVLSHVQTLIEKLARIRPKNIREMKSRAEDIKKLITYHLLSTARRNVMVLDSALQALQAVQRSTRSNARLLAECHERYNKQKLKTIESILHLIAILPSERDRNRFHNKLCDANDKLLAQQLSDEQFIETLENITNHITDSFLTYIGSSVSLDKTSKDQQRITQDLEERYVGLCVSYLYGPLQSFFSHLNNSINSGNIESFLSGVLKLIHFVNDACGFGFRFNETYATHDTQRIALSDLNRALTLVMARYYQKLPIDVLEELFSGLISSSFKGLLQLPSLFSSAFTASEHGTCQVNDQKGIPVLRASSGLYILKHFFLNLFDTIAVQLKHGKNPTANTTQTSRSLKQAEDQYRDAAAPDTRKQFESVLGELITQGRRAECLVTNSSNGVFLEQTSSQEYFTQHSFLAQFVYLIDVILRDQLGSARFDKIKNINEKLNLIAHYFENLVINAGDIHSGHYSIFTFASSSLFDAMLGSLEEHLPENVRTYNPATIQQYKIALLKFRQAIIKNYSQAPRHKHFEDSVNNQVHHLFELQMRVNQNPQLQSLAVGNSHYYTSTEVDGTSRIRQLLSETLPREVRNLEDKRAIRAALVGLASITRKKQTPYKGFFGKRQEQVQTFYTQEHHAMRSTFTAEEYKPTVAAALIDLIKEIYKNNNRNKAIDFGFFKPVIFNEQADTIVRLRKMLSPHLPKFQAFHDRLEEDGITYDALDLSGQELEDLAFEVYDLLAEKQKPLLNPFAHRLEETRSLQREMYIKFRDLLASNRAAQPAVIAVA